MEYILLCKNKEELLFYNNKLIVDGFILGIDTLSLDSEVNFSNLEELAKIIEELTNKNKKIFIDLKVLIHNEQIDYLKKVLKFLDNFSIEVVMFTDPCIYMLTKELNLKIKLMYSLDMLITHSNIFKILNDITNINVFSISKEITKENIKEIIKKIKYDHFLLEYQVFGPLRMFYSKRKLINNFLSYIDKEDKGNNKKEYDNYLFDKERNNYYYINQNISGTHIFSPKNICLIDELDFFKENNSFKYLSFNLKNIPKDYFIEVYNCFINARSLCLEDLEKYNKNKQKFYKEILEISDKHKQFIDKGFFYKPTVY